MAGVIQYPFIGLKLLFAKLYVNKLQTVNK